MMILNILGLGGLEKDRPSELGKSFTIAPNRVVQRNSKGGRANIDKDEVFL